MTGQRRNATHGLSRVELRSRRRASWRHTPHTGAPPRPPLVLHAPTVFSVVDNPRGTAEYLCGVRRNLQSGRNVRVAMGSVMKVTPDALLALITVADSIPLPGRGRLSGDLPLDPQARELVQTCGFQQLVQGLNSGTTCGIVNTKWAKARSGHNADAELAHAVVAGACKMAGVPYHKPSYANLIECMTNTNNHARPDDSAEALVQWRLMASVDVAQRKLRFVFMDPGLGICRTVRRQLHDFAGDDILLEALMNPVRGFRSLVAGLPAATRTGLRGRGRGLRMITESISRGQLTRPVVVANSGYVDVAAANRQALNDSGFEGTLIYWEIGLTGS